MERVVCYADVNYIVSDDGKIYSTKNIGRGKYHQEIKQRCNADGYMEITVGVNSRRRKCGVHRLVAMAFVENPCGYAEVNHINCIRNDNRAENLEWTTHIDNVRHSAALGKYKHYGEQNPNFGSTTLKQKYANHPELAQLCARPRSLNGRAKSVIMYDEYTQSTQEYHCLMDCAEYLINNKLVRGTSTSAIAQKIGQKALDGGIYFKRFRFQIID